MYPRDITRCNLQHIASNQKLTYSFKQYVVLNQNASLPDYEWQSIETDTE